MRCLLEQERPEDAEQEARRTLEMVERADEPRVMRLRYTFTQALLMQGMVDQAINQLEALLADQDRVLGRHPDTEATQELLAKARQGLQQSPASAASPPVAPPVPQQLVRDPASTDLDAAPARD